MTESTSSPLVAGQNINGFNVTAVTPLDEIEAVAYELRHTQSGARVLHIHNGDAENLFSINFSTPPPDSTGLPHILEHSVLAGSEQFPVREPFFEMIKMSMATFINAMTGPDLTYYPVCSNVKADLFNLAQVYFDAVFHPLLTEDTFRREAYHVAPADKNDPTGGLTVNGIVYNEMKGAFSNPEGCLYRAAYRGLCPDTLYGRESGGDPKVIPDLSYDDFLEFHKTYYHPENALIVLYGNIPTTDTLEFLAPRLNAFGENGLAVAFERQERWSTAREQEDTYPAGPDESLDAKTYVTMSWLAFDAADPLESLQADLLELILFGNEAAALKKAIIDSGLGADLILSGAGSLGFEGIFSVGIKGTEPANREAFQKRVIDELTRIADAGIAPAEVDAAFQQVAYHHLEIGTNYPLHIMSSVLSSWNYGRDPLVGLQMRSYLKTLRERYDKDPDLFSTLIRKWLLENPHRLTVTLTPDREMAGRTAAAFEKRMADERAELNDEEAQEVADAAEALDRLNDIPNSPEALALLPQLSISDLPRKLTHIPTAIETVGGIELLRNDVPSNGINTLILDFDLQGLPADLWSYLPHYAEAINKLGAAGMGYEAIAHRRAASTGGLWCSPVLATHASSADQPAWRLRFYLKSLDDGIVAALELLHDLLFSVDPRDTQRLHDMLSQTVVRCRTNMVHDGRGTAVRHAARGLTPEGFLEEQVRGLPHLALSSQLLNAFKETHETMIAKIEAFRDVLLLRNRLTASFTGTDVAYSAARAALSTWVGNMPDTSLEIVPVGFTPYTTPPREGLAGPIQVSHGAMVMPAPHLSHPDEPLLAVASHLVRMDYALPELRFKGNAYGAGFDHNPIQRRITISSFNDPHIVRTLGVFNGVRDFVAEAEWTQVEIDRAIIATAKNQERPIRPFAATGDALERHVTGMTPERREQRFEKLKGVTPAAARQALLNVLEEGLPNAAVCVVSSRSKLEQANSKLKDAPLAIKDILD